MLLFQGTRGRPGQRLPQVIKVNLIITVWNEKNGLKKNPFCTLKDWIQDCQTKSYMAAGSPVLQYALSDCQAPILGLHIP